MMLKCTKCGFENQLGSIFCRGCGEKLDTSSLDNHETIDMKAAARKKSSSLPILIVLIILIPVLAAATLAWTLLQIPSDYKQSQADTAKIERLMRKGKNVSISPNELSALFQKFITEDKNEGIRGVMIQSEDKDLLKFFIYAEWNGRDILYTVTAKIRKSNDAEMPMNVVPVSCRLGLLPMLIRDDLAREALDKVMKTKSFRDLTNKASAIEFNDGKLTVTYGK